MSKLKFKNITTDAKPVTTTVQAQTEVQTVVPQGKSCAADKVLCRLWDAGAALLGGFAEVARGDRRIEFHMPVQARELTVEEQLEQENQRIQRELDRRTTPKVAAPKVKPISKMTVDELKAYQSNLHRELERRRKQS